MLKTCRWMRPFPQPLRHRGDGNGMTPRGPVDMTTVAATSRRSRRRDRRGRGITGRRAWSGRVPNSYTHTPSSPAPFPGPTLKLRMRRDGGGWWMRGLPAWWSMSRTSVFVRSRTAAWRRRRMAGLGLGFGAGGERRAPVLECLAEEDSWVGEGERRAARRRAVEE